MTGRDANRGACAQPCRYQYALVEEKRPGEYFPDVYKRQDQRFALMSAAYEDEQESLKAEVQTLQKEIEAQERQLENFDQFIQRVHKYTDLRELTPYALRELVKAIYIEAPDKSSGKRRQGIRIAYDLSLIHI